MRWLICAGGTGGGVYPALSVLSEAQALNEAQAPAGPADPQAPETLWVGGVGGMEEELVKRAMQATANLSYDAIPAAGVHGVGLRRLPGNSWQLWRGFLRSRAILSRFRPDVLFFTGGYVAVPMALAARVLPRRTPILLYVPDIEPGLALKTLARFADCIAVTTPDSRAYFPHHKRVVVTGYPVRPELRAWSLPERRAEARRSLGLDPALPTLLVFGGSSGARSINRALLAVLPELLGSSELQVVHLSGRLDWDEVEAAQKRLAPEAAARYRAFPYLHEMGMALLAADLVVSRAGASALGEFPLFGLPAVLVPYPYAWRYQQTNAEYLAGRGAARIVADADLSSQLLPLVRQLMGDPGGLESMRQAMLSLAQPQAAESIANLLRRMAAGETERSAP